MKQLAAEFPERKLPRDYRWPPRAAVVACSCSTPCSGAREAALLHRRGARDWVECVQVEPGALVHVDDLINAPAAASGIEDRGGWAPALTAGHARDET